MAFLIILGIVLWICVSLAPALIARKKGYNFFLFWIISLFFWWITLFVTLFMKPRVVGAEPSSDS